MRFISLKISYKCTTMPRIRTTDLGLEGERETIASKDTLIHESVTPCLSSFGAIDIQKIDFLVTQSNR